MLSTVLKCSPVVLSACLACQVRKVRHQTDKTSNHSEAEESEQFSANVRQAKKVKHSSKQTCLPAKQRKQGRKCKRNSQNNGRKRWKPLQFRSAAFLHAMSHVTGMIAHLSNVPLCSIEDSESFGPSVLEILMRRAQCRSGGRGLDGPKLRRSARRTEQH